MSKLQKIVTSFAGILMIVVIGFVVAKNNPVDTSVGSVAQGNEYHSTTTSTGRFPTTVTVQTYPSGGGVLGSVVITGAATGVINIFDATTSNSTLRDSTQSSSTILVASFPASTAAGTYTFDVALYRGLLVDVAGTMPTTTITYR